MRRLIFFLVLVVWMTSAHAIYAAYASYAVDELTLAHIGGGTSPQHTAAATFIREIEQRLPGRFRITERGGTMMGGEADIWQAVRLGIIDLAITTTPAIVPFVPQLGILNVPFLFRDVAHATAVFDGPIGQELGMTVLNQGVVCLAFIQRGFNQITNSRRPIRHPADVAGLKIRIIPNPVYEATFRALGAEVVPMPWPGVYGALDDGRIDGQENPLLALSGQFFHRVQKYLSLTAISQGPMLIVVNSEIFKGLTPQEQAVFTEAARAGAIASLRATRAGESAMIDEFRREGVTITETIDRDAFQKALAKLEPEWENRFGATLLARIRGMR